MENQEPQENLVKQDVMVIQAVPETPEREVKPDQLESVVYQVLLEVKANVVQQDYPDHQDQLVYLENAEDQGHRE